MFNPWLLPIESDSLPGVRGRPELCLLAAPILMSGALSTCCKGLGAGAGGFGGGGAGIGGGSGGGFGTSTLADPPPPKHIINSPFVV
jgi:hypothetical protein